MSCRGVRRKISRYFDAELPLSESRLLEAHLAQCRACAAELAELRGIEALLRETAIPPPPPGLARSLMRRAGTEGSSRALARPWLEALKAWPLAMKFAATGMALLAVYLGLLISAWTGPQAPADEVAWLRSVSLGPVAAAYQGVSR
jgi:anti-sigma factor RsiW